MSNRVSAQGEGDRAGQEASVAFRILIGGRPDRSSSSSRTPAAAISSACSSRREAPPSSEISNMAQRSG